MQKGEATRQKIIEQAAPVFNQLGFAGATMLDIMQVTGLEKGGIYRHFSGKQELAGEAFRYCLSQAVQARIPPVDKKLSPVAHLRHMVWAFVERPSPVPGGCPIMNAGVDTDDTNPELFQLAQEGLQFWKAKIKTIVLAGIRGGEIQKTANPERISNQIIATLEGALLISRLEQRKDALSHAQEVLDELINDIAL